MKIAILDGAVLNPGDVDWTPITSLGDVSIYETTPTEAVAERTHGADVVLVNKTPLTGANLEQLDSSVRMVGVLATGYNIVDTETLAARVRAEGADIGLALDGDADRLIVVDETGRVVDGDQIMALIAAAQAEAGLLKGGALVATVMSNMGLEKHLETLGIGLLRTPVGDRHVLEAMRANGCNVGGEQSGHIILSDHATTGDGLLAALQVLAVLVRDGRPASELLARFTPWPQLLKNVKADPRVLETAAVKAAIAASEADLAGRGRLLVRKSGTEPLVRVMAEGLDATLVETSVDRVCAAVAGAG